MSTAWDVVALANVAFLGAFIFGGDLGETIAITAGFGSLLLDWAHKTADREDWD